MLRHVSVAPRSPTYLEYCYDRARVCVLVPRNIARNIAPNIACKCAPPGCRRVSHQAPPRNIARNIAVKCAPPGCTSVGTTPQNLRAILRAILRCHTAGIYPGRVRPRNIARNIACNVALPHGWKRIPAMCAPANLRAILRAILRCHTTGSAYPGKVRPRKIARNIACNFALPHGWN